jgi:hypothetical protein
MTPAQADDQGAYLQGEDPLPIGQALIVMACFVIASWCAIVGLAIWGFRS